MNKYLNIITCTYPRPHRLHYLNHLKVLLSFQDHIRWFVIDDNHMQDKELQEFLPNFAIYKHIGPSKDKGHIQRNLALEYIYDMELDGIIYNADDDNRYDIRIFDEIRKSIHFSMFPVGGDIRGVENESERPVVDPNTKKFIKWDSPWHQRKYPMDMGGFAFNSLLLHKLEKPFWQHAGVGGESEFIDKIINSVDDIEFLCDNCTKTWVFHNALDLDRK